ncbi:TonB-linked outer membrane protein, SusC/RagA family [Arachidicoccus rhizosphaerae]|uniref:TonB-linked outer membrane protein, SusC/RagA family n=2 Tax=Arachidicoccus rhizosphaerae TaxID=551991 RepID=A0A1H3XNK9_9BACT|nr:TonB-linked outer membrane protein, SusC/RagA family [Arachidicoccus rhizosphaerae]
MACAFGAVGVKAQSVLEIKISAKVYDQNQNPIANALIQSQERADVHTLTDSNGAFSLMAEPGENIFVSAPGFTSLYLPASKQLNIIKLNPTSLDTIDVQAPFSTSRKEDLFGDVTVVNQQEIMAKNYTTYSLDGLVAYVPGYNGNSIWGMGSYLLLVDGVPRDANNVLPTEIDQIAVLKGVEAVALYGSKGAKGVINITTKRGQAFNKKLIVRADMGTYVPVSYPKYLGSAEYMSLYNEARSNDSLPALYDEATIYHYASNENEYRYPNVDYYSDSYLKRAYNRYDATAEISGGNDRARYYTNMGFYTEGSLLDFGMAKENRNSRFNLRGNVDIKINRFINGRIDATATFYDGRGVNADYWSAAATVRPNRFTPLVPIDMIESNDEASLLLVQNSDHVIDGKYLLGGTQLDQTNTMATIYAGGYNKYISRQFQFSSGIDADLKDILPGLKFKSNFAVDYATAYSLSYNYDYATYEPIWNNYAGQDLISSLNKYGNDATSGTQNVSNSWYRQTIAFYGLFSYDQTFGTKNNVSSELIANGYQQSESEVYHRVSNANLGLHAGYNYDHKYYIDFKGAYIHSAKLPENHREALSPTLSIAWRISKEPFMHNKTGVVNDLKITASAGILNTDIDISDYYMYQGYYTVAGSWYGWKDGTGFQATESRRGNNPNMSFPRRKEINIGFEGLFFNSSLQLSSHFFRNTIDGNIIQASSLFPSYFTSYWPVSSFIPYINYDRDQRTGVDFGLDWHKLIGKLDVDFGLNGTYYTTKATRRAEVYEDAYQYRQGKSLDGIWGLQNLGFFESQEDIDNSPTQSFGEVHPGDIKYKDQNGDGVINSQDEVFLGKGGWFGAPFTIGMNLTVKYKKLTLFMYGTGSYGAYGVKNNSYYWVYGDGKYSEVVRNRWTEETKATATYPRLTTNSSDNNFRTSDFWMYKANRFDLSKVQLSYDMTGLLKSKGFINTLGVYVSGANLLTISKHKDIMQLNIGSAPQTRFYNIGVKANF